jgi:hypothetical protein
MGDAAKAATAPIRRPDRATLSTGRDQHVPSLQLGLPLGPTPGRLRFRRRGPDESPHRATEVRPPRPPPRSVADVPHGHPTTNAPGPRALLPAPTPLEASIPSGLDGWSTAGAVERVPRSSSRRGEAAAPGDTAGTPQRPSQPVSVGGALVLVVRQVPDGNAARAATVSPLCGTFGAADSHKCHKQDLRGRVARDVGRHPLKLVRGTRTSRCPTQTTQLPSVRRVG